jgi:hypothetical protein
VVSRRSTCAPHPAEQRGARPCWSCECMWRMAQDSHAAACPHGWQRTSRGRAKQRKQAASSSPSPRAVISVWRQFRPSARAPRTRSAHTRGARLREGLARPPEGSVLCVNAPPAARERGGTRGRGPSGPGRVSGSSAPVV